MGGPLVTRISRLTDLAGSKYACRIPRLSEDPPYPEDVFLEALTNALVHNDYSQRVPVTAEFTTESVTFTSGFGLPPENTEETVLRSGESVPGNPTLAEVLRIAGLISLEGTGLETIRDGTSYAPASQRILANRFSTVLASRTPYELRIVPRSETRSAREREILTRCDRPDGMSSKDFVFDLGLPVRQVTKKYMTPLREKGLLEFTIPEKPYSNLQRYRTTRLGRKSLRPDGQSLR